MRAKGTIVTLPDKEPTGFYADEAKKIQKQRQERKIIADAKPPRPVPNYICYSFVFPNYDPKTGKGAPRPLPKCKPCGGVIHPQEHHVCPGFQPMFPTTDPEERRAKWEEQREMIREAKRNGLFFDECSEDEPEEDWDEGDYCEGDDDGWECEDDGDPMWE
jgi:hypothetical protein